MQEIIEKLVRAKANAEAITVARKKLQEELLNNKEYKALNDAETVAMNEYEQLRSEVIAQGKKNNTNGTIEVDSGKVAFSYTRSFSLEDEAEFVKYCKQKKVYDKLYKHSLSAKDFKSYMSEKDNTGQEVPWVVCNDDISIKVFIQ